MKKLDNSELMEVNGGMARFVKYGILGLLAVGAFIGSVIYGYIHPVKC